MKIFHLCTYYIGNQLYQKLFQEMSKVINHQTVYIPIRNEKQLNRNFFKDNNVDFSYDFILNKKDRFFYKGKIKKQLNMIENKFANIQDFDLIHAHTLYSDGGTAYLAKKNHGINYVVSVRGTDINVFYKYAIHNRKFAYKVLKEAKMIIFISYSYKSKVFNKWPKEIVDQIKHKTVVIPNGIDDIWYKKDRNYRIKNKKINLMFTGSLDNNKNLITVLNLVKELKGEHEETVLHVAGDGPLKEKLQEQTKLLGLIDNVQFYGNISVEKLMEVMQGTNIFILPSFKETFGISYIEAMSQGLPVIYTRNEGIDGYFTEGSVGYSTNPNDIHEMKEIISKIMNDYEKISYNCIKESKRFNWKSISQDYINIYNKVKE